MTPAERRAKSLEQCALEKGYKITEEGVVIGPSGEQVKTRPGRDDYPRFTVRNRDGKARPLDVHRLAALQWFGDALYEPGIETRHLNGNINDFSRSNIAIGTKGQNQMDKTPEMRRSQANHAASFVRKLTPAQVANLRADREQGASYDELRLKYGVAKSTISYVVNNKTYAA